MEIQHTSISDLLIIKPAVFNDDRGYFYEVFNQVRYCKEGLNSNFIQDNLSYSVKGTIRGLHYQSEPYAQAKLIQVLKGRVLDIAVDLRNGSPTYGKHFAIELSQENKLQFFIPRGFAHGFSVLSDDAIFYYKCDNEYNKAYERGIVYNDESLKIDWKIPSGKEIVSPKDLMLPSFIDSEINFTFSE